MNAGPPASGYTRQRALGVPRARLHRHRCVTWATRRRSQPPNRRRDPPPLGPSLVDQSSDDVDAGTVTIALPKPDRSQASRAGLAMAKRDCFSRSSDRPGARVATTAFARTEQFGSDSKRGSASCGDARARGWCQHRAVNPAPGIEQFEAAGAGSRGIPRDDGPNNFDVGALAGAEGLATMSYMVLRRWLLERVSAARLPARGRGARRRRSARRGWRTSLAVRTARFRPSRRAGQSRLMTAIGTPTHAVQRGSTRWRNVAATTIAIQAPNANPAEL